jgi:acyl carrier protein
MGVERLARIFREVFEDDTIELVPTLVAKDVKNWDSVHHIYLMIAIETEYDVILTPAEVENISCLGDLVGLLQAKGCDISW